VIAGLKPYAEYRDSGLPWLGQVPAHWRVQRIKTILREVDRRSANGTERLLSLRMNVGLVDHHALGGKHIPPSVLIGYKHVLPGEMVMNRMRASTGLFAVATSEGLVSPDYAIFQKVAPVNLDYAVQLFKTPAMATIFRLESTGLGTGESGFLRLYSDQFGRLAIPMPSTDEQKAIVQFLNSTSGRFERAIKAKRKVVALLTEQKQAVIQRAVARGFDPAVLCKSSGDSWLGEIPEHWTVWRISRFARVGNGSTPSRARPNYWNGGTYPWLNSSQVNRASIDSADQFITRAALRECHLPRVPAGSVLVAITGQGKTRGKAAPLAIEATINQHIAYITPRLPIVSTDYLHLALTAAYRQLRAISDDAGSTKGALTCEDLKRLKIALPPRQEQDELIERIRIETGALTAAAGRLEREIELLREYRTRLVADVVTGQLDVREAALQLPVETSLGLGVELEDEADDSELIDEEATEA
jgi:type I restriction enzyme S subunit